MYINNHFLFFVLVIGGSLLIRCGRDRYVAQAQDVKARMNYVEQVGDYVRDVSVPAKILDQMSSSPFVSFRVKQAIESMRAF